MSVTLDEDLEPIGKSIARKWYRSFCKAVLKHPVLSRLMLQQVANKVRSECTSLVSIKAPSILRKKSKGTLTCFNWEDLVNEWENRAPTFLMLLTAAADKHWHTKAKTISTKCIPPLCMAGVILLKTRNKHTSALQTMTSILLNAGHCSSQVCVQNQFHFCANYAFLRLSCDLIHFRHTHDSTGLDFACHICRL